MQDRRYRLASTPPFLRAVLRTPGQCVWFAVFRTGAIEDFEINTDQFLGPVGLPPVENLGGGEVLEVLVV